LLSGPCGARTTRTSQELTSNAHLHNLPAVRVTVKGAGRHDNDHPASRTYEMTALHTVKRAALALALAASSSMSLTVVPPTVTATNVPPTATATSTSTSSIDPSGRSMPI